MKAIICQKNQKNVKKNMKNAFYEHEKKKDSIEV